MVTVWTATDRGGAEPEQGDADQINGCAGGDFGAAVPGPGARGPVQHPGLSELSGGARVDRPDPKR